MKIYPNGTLIKFRRRFGGFLQANNINEEDIGIVFNHQLYYSIFSKGVFYKAIRFTLDDPYNYKIIFTPKG